MSFVCDDDWEAPRALGDSGSPDDVVYGDKVFPGATAYQPRKGEPRFNAANGAAAP